MIGTINYALYAKNVMYGTSTEVYQICTICKICSSIFFHAWKENRPCSQFRIVVMALDAWICFGTLFLFEWNNPSLQIRSFGGNRGQCNGATGHVILPMDFPPLSVFRNVVQMY